MGNLKSRLDELRTRLRLLEYTISGIESVIHNKGDCFDDGLKDEITLDYYTTLKSGVYICQEFKKVIDENPKLDLSDYNLINFICALDDRLLIKDGLLSLIKALGKKYTGRLLTIFPKLEEINV